MSLGVPNAELLSKTAEENAHEEEKRRWTKLLAHDDFLWFLHLLIDRTGLLEQVERSSGEANIKAGEKNIGIFIQDKILNFAPERLHKILNYKTQ